MARAARRLTFYAVPWLAVLALFALGEAAARWSVSRRPKATIYSGAEHPPYFNAPGVVTSPPTFGYPIDYRINALGLRGPELSKEGSAPRMLILGDSVVYGLAVQDGETLPAQLERRLREETGKPWEVLNGGVSGYGAKDYAGFFKLKGLSLKPDAVVVGVYMNDHTSASEAGRAAPKRQERSFAARLASFCSRSQLFKAAAELVRRSQRVKFRLAPRPALSKEQERALDAYFPGDEATRAAARGYLRDYRYGPELLLELLPELLDLKAWREIRLPLGEIARECAKRKIKLLVVLFPTQPEVYPGWSWPEPQATIAGELRKLGVPVLDLKRPFQRTARGDELFAQPGDVAHPSAEGYELASAVVHNKLRELGWLER